MKDALSVAFLADYLLATQRSSTQDRAVCRTSPLTAVKSLRWFSKHAEWQELQEALSSSVIAAYAKSTACQDRREAYPVPLALLVAFEHAVCCRHTPDKTASHCLWVQFSCAATPVCALESIASVQAKLTQGMPRPDFAFLHCTLASHEVSGCAPASYLRTLLHLRWLAQHSALLGPAALLPQEAQQITLHSMKSTLLACAAQMKMSEEHRMLQGHHRSSARLYSRNDAFGSLHLQRTATEAICNGFRLQRSMSRGAQAPLPEPPFYVGPAWPTGLLPPH